MEYYKIIADNTELEYFINNVLPDLEDNECYYISLFARNKYYRELTHIKSDKAQLKRFTANKENLIQKLKQLECPVGSYNQKYMIVPQQALAVYITINPRHYIKATYSSLITLATLIGKKADGYNPHQHVMSEIQRSCSRKVYVDFDFDISIPPEEFLGKLYSTVNFDSLTVIKTRGGYHTLVKPNLISGNSVKTWYKDLKGLGSDQCGDLMIPIPGCYQGGLDFVTHIIQ